MLSVHPGAEAVVLVLTAVVVVASDLVKPSVMSASCQAHPVPDEIGAALQALSRFELECSRPGADSSMAAHRLCSEMHVLSCIHAG
jgi:hypothetical protein